MTSRTHEGHAYLMTTLFFTPPPERRPDRATSMGGQVWVELVAEEEVSDEKLATLKSWPEESERARGG